jgi:MYXO-CTERM domain-containing protein
VITGTVALTMSGSGTQVLAGSNTYSGGTIVNSGALLVNNSTGSGTGSGSITVAGGTLGGSGTIGTASTNNGAITVNGGGLIAAGPNSSTTGLLTTLSTNGITFNGGSGYLWKINNGVSGAAGASSGWDEIATQGITFGSGTALSAGSQFTVYISGDSNVTAPGVTSYIIATDPVGPIMINGSAYSTASGPVALTGTGTPGALANLFSLNTGSYAGNESSFQLELAADGASGQELVVVGTTPEPGSMGLLGVATLGLLRRRRK